MIRTKLVDQECELKSILALQAANLRRNLAEEEAAREGFLTAEYELDYLRRMNQSEPSVVAVDGDRIVGYALAATQAIRHGNPLLADLFRQIDPLDFRGKLLREVPYVVVGQLCIAKGYRGIGLVGQIYGHFRRSMQGRYQCAVTDVARSNVRSLKAHWKMGFRTIHSISFDGLEWEVVLWNWNDSELSDSVGS
ncbi:MAG: GNAT family N-acetyltransferase [Verrucomicrobiales bacterium]|nr:GNAT family N-acetyltransferase [Verrucomicrobiales bacterium]